MSISAAQFLQWIRSQSSQLVTLAELSFGFQSGGLPAAGTIYFSDRSYITKPWDTPANRRYRDVIATTPDVERAISLAQLGGRGITNPGTITLNNADGALDFLLDAILDGRDIKFYVGDKSWARSDFRLMNVLVVESVDARDDKQIVLTLKDRGFLLDAAIIGDVISSGPNAGRPKPVVMGRVYNFDAGPYLFDTANLLYYLNNFALSPDTFWNYVTAVRDSGGSLDSGVILGFTSGSMTANAGTDTLTYVSAHGLAADDVIYMNTSSGTLFAGLSGLQQYWVLASGLTSTSFKLSLTKGGAAVDVTGTVMTGSWTLTRRRFYVDAAAATLQLSSSPAGRVTLDWVALDAAGELGLALEAHNAFKYMLRHYTQLGPADYDSAAIDVLVTAERNLLYWGDTIFDRINVLDELDKIAKATYSWYAPNHAGVLTVGRLDLANLDAAAPVVAIGKDNLIGDLQAQNQPLPWGRMVIDASKNVVTQTDGLLSTVSADNRSRWALPYPRRVKTTDPPGADYPNDWWNYHKSATDSAPQETVLADDPILTTPNAVQFACDQMTELFRPWTRVYRMTAGLEAYFLASGACLNPGDCVTLSYPRYKLDAGKNCRVISVKPRLSDREVELVLVRREIPDYLTATHV